MIKINIASCRIWLLLMFLMLSSFFGYSQQQKDSVAENMLRYQRYNGGWAKAVHGKKISYDHALTKEQVNQVVQEKNLNDATIDNKATTKEINYLFEAFGKTRDSAYLLAAEKGLDYLLNAQYDNGGWPQYYPDSSLYRSQVTFNDNAIINVLILLNNVANKKSVFAAAHARYIPRCRMAVNKGIDCILKTQIIVNGQKTAWNQQYNKTTLLPEKARSFELVGLAASESVAIVAFLMRIPKPSIAIKTAIKGAMTWFEQVAIKGYRLDHIIAADQPTGKDAIVVKDPNSTLWARYYEIETNRPFFCGRNGVKKYNLKEIENERRAGYSWYGTWPARLIEKDYPRWLLKNE